MYFLFFIIGAAVGSFLNVCIVRLPHEKSVVIPRSHCVHCKQMIPWYDNIPFVSYLILGGKCRFCKAKISLRYFIVELITAVTFVLLYQYYGLTPVLVAYLTMMCGFIVATFVDFGHRIIPDEVSIGGTLAGMLFSLFIPALHGIVPVAPVAGNPFWKALLPYAHSAGVSILGVLIGGGSIYLMGMLGEFLFKKEAMGGGDVKLMAMIGAFLGWQNALLAFFIAPLFGTVYGIIEKIRTGDTTMAYGPFLVLGAVIAQFRGEEIIAWILRGYGIY